MEFLEAIDPILKAKLLTNAKLVVANSSTHIVRVDNEELEVSVSSNSTMVKEFAFLADKSLLSFKIEGKSGTNGVEQVTVPED